MSDRTAKLLHAVAVRRAPRLTGDQAETVEAVDFWPQVRSAALQGRPWQVQ